MVERRAYHEEYQEIPTPVEIYNAGTQRRWLRTMLLPGMTPDFVFRLIQIDDNISLAAQSREGGLAKNIKSSFSKPGTKFETTAALLQTSSIDPQGKAAQAFRLMTQGREALRIDDLATLKPGKLVQYLRIARGEYLHQMAATTPWDRITLAYHEHGVSTVGMPPNIAEVLCNSWLKLPQESTLRKVILSVHGIGDPVSKEEMQKLGGEPYLFLNYEPRPPIMSVSVKSDIAAMENVSRLGDAMRVLRQRHGVERKDIAARVQSRYFDKRNQQNYESGERLPSDYMLGVFAKAVNPSFTVHNPLLYYLLSRVDRERAERKGEVFTVPKDRYPHRLFHAQAA